MFCPRCGGRQPAGITECPRCHIPLSEHSTASGPPADPGELDLVTVLATGNPALLALAHSLLESAGIEFIARGEGVQDLVGLGRVGGFNVALGAVELQVRARDADEARAILADLHESETEEIEDPADGDDGERDG
jgi:hypothetical protein